MSQAERYRKPADLPTQLPVFPLRGAILLPRATLRLNMFEPRYLAMVDDALASQRLIGILQPGGSKSGPPSADDDSPPGKDFPLRKIGCVGRLTSFEEADAGRMIIGLTGVARFQLVSEVATEKPYRTVTVSYEPYASDFSQNLGEDRIDRENLLRVLKIYLETNRLQADWGAITRARGEVLVNALSVMSPYGPEEKQALLEACDLKTRAEVLIALAEMELATTAGRSSGSGNSGGTLQ